ncbi:LOW QUALITY PROTEIN: proton-coupled zinc antiporter SLC30A2-like [Amphiura filiformis]|uniref:LOW QUALITY PROTEIN: proton-coupled zinc antiporter SLC30A2-like n=1 Tax=Amphiura filiformis TaxID=82378 RepID=UPI003B2207E7
MTEIRMPRSPIRGLHISRKHSEDMDDMKLVNNTDSDYGAVEKHHHSVPHSRHEILVQARKKLILACLFSAALMIAQVIGGYLAQSLAIMTDAAHMFTDFIGFVIGLFAIWLSHKPPTKYMNYGWHRAEVLGALFSLLVIWVLTGILVYMAIERIIHNEYEVDGKIMLVTAVIGLFVNICLGVMLHGHSHDGGDGVSQSLCWPTDCATKSEHSSEGYHDNFNIRAAFLHVIGDIVQSIGVCIAAIIIFIDPSLKIVDPICTFMFSALVVLTTFRLLRDTLRILMEAKPPHVDYLELRRQLVEIDGVEGVHSLHIWSLTTGLDAVSVHLVLASLYDGESVDTRGVLQQARFILETKFQLITSAVQIEMVDDGVDYQCAKAPGPV